MACPNLPLSFAPGSSSPPGVVFRCSRRDLFVVSAWPILHLHVRNCSANSTHLPALSSDSTAVLMCRVAPQCVRGRWSVDVSSAGWRRGVGVSCRAHRPISQAQGCCRPALFCLGFGLSRALLSMRVSHSVSGPSESAWCRTPHASQMGKMLTLVPRRAGPDGDALLRVGRGRAQRSQDSSQGVDPRACAELSACAVASQHAVRDV
eukprot:3223485-Rhodomonas_salina.1